LKFKGTEDTYLCPDCKKIVYGEQRISSHMEEHQRLDRERAPSHRTCNLEGCEKKGHRYFNNNGYREHEVSVVLGQIHSTYNAAPSEPKFINRHWQPLLLESLLVNKSMTRTIVHANSKAVRKRATLIQNKGGTSSMRLVWFLGRFTQLTMPHLARQISSTGTGSRYCWKVCW
jgi:hypothetical protein